MTDDQRDEVRAWAREMVRKSIPPLEMIRMAREKFRGYGPLHNEVAYGIFQTKTTLFNQPDSREFVESPVIVHPSNVIPIDFKKPHGVGRHMKDLLPGEVEIGVLWITGVVGTNAVKEWYMRNKFTISTNNIASRLASVLKRAHSQDMIFVGRTGNDGTIFVETDAVGNPGDPDDGSEGDQVLSLSGNG